MNYSLSVSDMHRDLNAIKQLVYDPNGYKLSDYKKEHESKEYGACSFQLNESQCIFRVAKITPIKVGQFVAVWKRIGKSLPQSYDSKDGVDFFVISTRDGNHFGQFIFPKSVLCERKIMSTNGKRGKTGMRVYPPWVKTTNKQAIKT